MNPMTIVPVPVSNPSQFLDDLVKFVGKGHVLAQETRFTGHLALRPDFLYTPELVARYIAGFYNSRGYKAESNKEGTLVTVKKDNKELYWIDVLQNDQWSYELFIDEHPLRDFLED